MVCLCRQGKVPADIFVLEFRDLCGDSTEADGVLHSLAHLLPTPELQTALLTASGTEITHQPVVMAPDAKGKYAKGAPRRQENQPQQGRPRVASSDSKQEGVQRDPRGKLPAQATAAAGVPGSSGAEEDQRRQQVVPDAASAEGTGGSCVAHGTADEPPELRDSSGAPEDAVTRCKA